jgi:uncharacterized membrane protein YdjX (TVP38/TMEM64 family)
MQQLVVVRRLMEQPLIIVLGLLTTAGAAKTGNGAWALGGIVTFASIYIGAVVTFMATRRMRHREALARVRQQPRTYGYPTVEETS